MNNSRGLFFLGSLNSRDNSADADHNDDQMLFLRISSWKTGNKMALFTPSSRHQAII